MCYDDEDYLADYLAELSAAQVNAHGELLHLALKLKGIVDPDVIQALRDAAECIDLEAGASLGRMKTATLGRVLDAQNDRWEERREEARDDKSHPEHKRAVQELNSIKKHASGGGSRGYQIIYGNS